MHFVAYLQIDCITQGADRQNWVFCGSDYMNVRQSVFCRRFRLHKLFGKVCSVVQTTWTFRQSVFCGSDYINFSAKCVLWFRLHKLFSKVCSVVQTTWTFRQSWLLWFRLHERFGKVDFCGSDYMNVFIGGLHETEQFALFLCNEQDEAWFRNQ